MGEGVKNVISDSVRFFGYVKEKWGGYLKFLLGEEGRGV